MKNLSLKILFATFLMLIQPVFAKSVHVKALTDFNSANPPTYMNVQVLDDVVLKDATLLKKDYKIHAQVLEVKQPTRLKQDAKFKLIPEYYLDELNIKHAFIHNFTASYTTVLDKGQAAKTAALTVGSHFVKGLSTGVSAIEGAIENQEGNRAKSAVKNVYESSPFSYVEKGKNLVIKKGDDFLLKFSLNGEETDDSDSSQNYTFTTQE